MKYLNITFLLVFLLAACSAKKEPSNDSSSNETVEEAQLKPLAELTYYEIWKILLKENDASGMDVHGDTFGTDGIELLEIKEEGNCADQDCGSKVMMTNTSDQEMAVIVSFAFDLPGNPTKGMERWYKLGPSESTGLGCSNFCYNGKTYAVSRNILSAGPSPEEE